MDGAAWLKMFCKNETSTKEFTDPPRELIFTSFGKSEGGAKVNEDEVIQVNVKWDKFEESFELHNKNK